VFRHLYVHIPYCVKKCPYCDFFSVADDRRMMEFLDALAAEFALLAAEYGPFTGIETVFIGGGTPTHLPAESVPRLGEVLSRHASLAPGYEWTIEANPESATPEQIARFMDIGANRVSVGVQSFDAGELALLGRAHSVCDAHAAARTLSSAGLASWSLDLMFGLAGQSLASWQQSVNHALAYRPPHLSSYALMIEPGSAYARDPEPERFCADEALVADEYAWLMETLTEAGYEHYELSNYALPGHRCRHNEAYWSRRPYLGLGPSAQSFDGRRRWWNVRSIDEYLDRLRDGRSPTTESETLEPEQVFDEVVMLSLRRKEGMAWSMVPSDRRGWVRSALLPMSDSGLVEIDREGVRLTAKGWPLADAVIRRIIAR